MGSFGEAGTTHCFICVGSDRLSDRITWDVHPTIVAGRECESCTLCCRVMRVPEIKKPQWEWCPDCEAGAGCRVYMTRPGECEEFLCGYRTRESVRDHWYPGTCHMVIQISQDGRVDVYVDPDFPDAWRGEPHLTDLREKARELLPSLGRVAVHLPGRVTVVLPDREVTFEDFGSGEEVGVMPQDDPGQPTRYLAFKRRRGSTAAPMSPDVR